MLNKEITEALTNIFDHDFRSKVEEKIGRSVILKLDQLTNNAYSIVLYDSLCDRYTFKKVITQSYLTPQPGCCGLIISHNACVGQDYQNKGIGELLNSYRLAIAKHLGYGTVICTDVAQNTAQNKILAKNGWEKIHQFENPRTGNLVNIYVVRVN